MEAVAIIVVTMLLIALLAFIIWIAVSHTAARRETAGQSASMLLLGQQIEAIKASQDALKETMQKSLLAGQSTLNENLQQSQRVLLNLNNQMGEIQGTGRQMLQVGEEVRRLQDILKSPKMRGQIGEWSLENLLAQVLPKDAYKVQHAFKDGKIVDALIKLADYSVSVDAKFPLPAFERLLCAETDELRDKQRKQFLKDITSHIDKIALSYIRPAEGTLDFALMYIPAENVYYETILKCDSDSRDIMQYALDKKVIPVSPNLFYAYLMTVVMGLHGLQIEKNIGQIQSNLKSLSSCFGDFMTSWETLGGHIRNSCNKYDEADKRLSRFGMQLERIQADSEKEKD